MEHKNFLFFDWPNFLCFSLQGKDAIVQLREEEFQAFLSQRRIRNRKERRQRPIEVDDDFDEDETDDLFEEEEDTYADDWEK